MLVEEIDCVFLEELKKEFVPGQLLHLEQPQAVLVQPFEVLENARIHDTPPHRERRCRSCLENKVGAIFFGYVFFML